MSRGVLNISLEGDSTSSLDSLFQCSVTLTIKTFFCMLVRNFLCSSFRPLFLVLLQHTTEHAFSKFHKPFHFLLMNMQTSRFTHTYLCIFRMMSHHAIKSRKWAVSLSNFVLSALLKSHKKKHNLAESTQLKILSNMEVFLHTKQVFHPGVFQSYESSKMDKLQRCYLVTEQDHP